MGDTVEIEVTPDGTVRGIYKDELAELYGALGKMKVARASNVEWELDGWTVRAAHDPNLAIRSVIKDGAYRLVVSREGELTVFVTREAALASELDHFWELLPKFEQKDEKIVLLTKREFDALAEYSCTVPTGVVVGKKWKRREPYRTDNDIPPTWYLGEYVEDQEWKGMVGIKWARIIVKPEPA